MGWVDFRCVGNTVTQIAQRPTNLKNQRTIMARRFLTLAWTLMHKQHPRSARGIKPKVIRVHVSDGVTDKHRCDGVDLCLAPSVHRGCKTATCMPDFDFIRAAAYSHLKETIEQTYDVPWAQKVDGLYWRGASTGQVINAPDDLRRNPRIRLCLESKRIKGADVRLSNIAQISDAGTKAAINGHGIVDRRRHIDQFLRHRYVVDIDGNTNAWSSFFWKLHSNSVVLKVGGSFRQWYYRRLEPWVHYVPVRSDLSDLDTQLRWCRSNARKCRAIARNATQFTRAVTYMGEAKWLGDQLYRRMIN